MSGAVVERASFNRWVAFRPRRNQENQLPLPLGYFTGELRREPEGSKNTNVGIYDKIAWRIAQKPLMSVFMTVFMMYMLGSSLNSIINITMLGAMVSQPVRTLMNMNKEFAGIREKSGQSFYLQQLVYFTVNAVAVLLVIYKCKSIGLVPSTEGDWLEFISIGQPQEYTSGGISM